MKGKKPVLTAWSDDLVLTSEMKIYAINNGVDPEMEFDAWHDDCLAHGRKYADWYAAFRTRVRNAVKFAGERKPIGFRAPSALSRPVPSAIARENAEIEAEVCNMTPEQREQARQKLHAIVAGIGKKI